MIKVLIVDDSFFMRVNLKLYLESNPNIKVIGIARNGGDAVEKNQNICPDVITMDVNMPGMSGIEAVKQIMHTRPTPIIMISSLTNNGAQETIKALEAGAVDYIPKNIIDNKVLIEKVYIAKESWTHPTNNKQDRNQVESSINIIKRKFAIVAIGISTGGPKALAELILRIAPNIRASIVITQHMPPVFTKSLAERLNTMTTLNVKEAEDKEKIEPGHVYICPGGMHILIEEKGIISLYPKDYFNHNFTPSADLLLSSIGTTYGSDAMCIIMTGMGSDGSNGAKTAKEHGSYIIAQSEITSTIFGMPKAVIHKGLHDEIVDLQNLHTIINDHCISSN